MLLIDITDTMHISTTDLSGRWCVENPMWFFPLKCSSFQLLLKPLQTCTPFQQQHSFSQWANVMSMCCWHQQPVAQCHCPATYSWTYAHLFLIESKCSFALQLLTWLKTATSVLSFYSYKLIKFSMFVAHYCALQTFWAVFELAWP